MPEPAPARVSVVIPTHNRAGALRRTLAALAAQTFPVARMEVVVSADGCTDDTEALVRQFDAPFRLVLVARPASGPGAARNAGAAKATGALLLFLDDDIEVGPDFVAAHVQGHEAGARTVVLGYLPPVLADQRGLFKANLRMWWEDMFHPMRDPAYRYSYKNLLSGNCSLPAALFAEVGGFDAVLRAHEDYELGYRLLQAGARFRFVEEAMGRHHEKTDLRRSLRRKFDEGRADVVLGQRYPELLPSLPLHRGLRTGRYGAVQRLLFLAPDLTMRLATGLVGLLPLLEALRMRRSWHHLLYLLQHGWYWRGVVAELPSQGAVRAFLVRESGFDGAAALEVDLQEGLSAAEARIDRAQPRALRICYGSYFIGVFGEEPGTECFRGVHLRPLLKYRFRWPLCVALMADRARAASPIPGGFLPGATAAPPSLTR